MPETRVFVSNRLPAPAMHEYNELRAVQAELGSPYPVGDFGETKMATDAFMFLEQLRCIELTNTERRTDPYIWPALIRVDNNTLNTRELVDIVTPFLGEARVVIKDAMRAGETAGMRSILRTRFEDNLNTFRLILVVALFEMDETPKDAMQAGFRAFKSELGAAIGDGPTLLALKDAEDRNDEVTRQAIIKAIQEQVEKRVKSAIENELSGWEKVKVLAGILDLDDPIGSDFITLVKKDDEEDLVLTRFTLNFESRRSIRVPTTSGTQLLEVVSKYEIQGRLQLRPVLVERCQAEIDAVNAAQAAVNNIEKEIKCLQGQLKDEGCDEEEQSLPREFIHDEIERLRDEELGPAMEALKDARLALQRCRLRQGVVGGFEEDGVITPPTFS